MSRASVAGCTKRKRVFRGLRGDGLQHRELAALARRIQHDPVGVAPFADEGGYSFERVAAKLENIFGAILPCRRHGL